MLSIRPAVNADVDSICALDRIAQESDPRRAFIQRSVEAGTCYIAVTADGRITGYAILDYSFYEQGFVSLLYVHPDWRHQGVGSLLMQHCEQICRTSKLFTSTNLSNLPMQALLAKLGYVLSGVIHHLDENDPELVYVKYLDSTD